MAMKRKPLGRRLKKIIQPQGFPSTTEVTNKPPLESVVFKTGATRRQVKPSYMHLIPTEALIALGERYYMGAHERGYGAWNWEAGIPYWNLIQHGMTHLANLGNQISNARQIKSSDSIVENAAAVMWAMAAVIHFQEFGNPAESGSEHTSRIDKTSVKE